MSAMTPSEAIARSAELGEIVELPFDMKAHEFLARSAIDVEESEDGTTTLFTGTTAVYGWRVRMTNQLTPKVAEARILEIVISALTEPLIGSAHAHYLEDELFVDALKAIADGAPDAQAIAKTALMSRSIDFERWYE